MNGELGKSKEKFTLTLDLEGNPYPLQTKSIKMF